jgi:hypothetical protein
VSLPVSVVSAGIVSGDLILGLSDGKLINCGRAQGPEGLRGPAGPIGPKGKDGKDGNTVLHSAGRPKPDMGVDGDHHVNTVDWEWSIKESGKWGRGQPLLASRANAKGEVTHADRWKAGGNRFFPMGGASSAVTVPPAATGGGLEPIIGNGQPLGANIWSPIAIDATGDLMEVTLYFSRSGGNEVYTCKVIAYRANTIGNLTIAWESAQPLNLPYTVEFNAVINGQELQLNVRSSTNWEAVRGRIVKL